MTPRLTPAALTISGEVPDDPNCDTRAFVGPIRCDCCGGHPGNGKCPTVPGGGGGPQEPHPVTFVNRSGATLYIYYALYKGGTFDCLNLNYDGTLADGDSRNYTIPADEVSWFKFQEDTTSKCNISNNKFEASPRGGSPTPEVITIL